MQKEKIAHLIADIHDARRSISEAFDQTWQVKCGVPQDFTDKEMCAIHNALEEVFYFLHKSLEAADYVEHALRTTRTKNNTSSSKSIAP